ncbi:MAG: glycosyltransferase [Gammaproteobacteria bacterium]|nr:glycosyltransferase [Gammaproteobacteria bacterium]
MRVLHVYKTYFPETQGGLEEVIRQIALETTARGVTNRILTLAADGGPTTIDRPEARVVRCHRDAEIASNGLSMQALPRFRGHAQWADLIHYHHPWPFADLLHCLFRPSAPALVTYHSDIVRQRRLFALYRPLMHRFLARVDRVVATSGNYAASSQVLQRYHQKTEIIPIGVDSASQPTATSAEIAAMRARVGSGFFLFIGVLRSYKGLDTLVDAATGTDVPVVIAGDGPERDALQRRANAAGSGRVHFLGRVSDSERSALFALAGAVVLPSNARSEAYGVALVEGAMNARALISTELGTGTTFVNRDGETGRVVAPNDVHALRAALEEFANHPERTRALGVAARERYERLLTADRMGSAYMALYERLLGIA